MTPLFPAIFVGGPPHSGKSTLLYRLSHALRQQQVGHYALRASPDGEGDWSQEAPLALVRDLRLRAKSDWTPAFAQRICRDIARRHLPLLVDVGGLLTPETEQVAAVCTHGLILSRDAALLPSWKTMLYQQGRTVIAELLSRPDGSQEISATTPALRGTITGLARGQSSDGVCFSALVETLRHYFSYSPDDLFRTHEATAGVDLVLHLERRIFPLPAHHPDQGPRWKPDELASLYESLPVHEPLALYGRAPIWLYAGLAAFSEPTPAVFNPFTGWVLPPGLIFASAPDPTRLRWDAVYSHAEATQISLSLPGSYLDYEDADDLPVPQVDTTRGVLLDGKLPTWLYAALARAYRVAAWVAVLQPQTGYIVVWSQQAAVPVGAVLPAPHASSRR